ncbi:MAG TPA: D-aminoacylase [Gemmatimonadaceae bacterium]|nr:D-aminoacylase [Gemmatimonadaceae bacterium]
MIMPRPIVCILRVVLLNASVSGFAAEAGAQGDTTRYDVLIAGGTVIDGSGAARFRADVALRGDRIVAVSRTPLPRDRAGRVIEATGLIVAPGFIDLHAHIEPLLNQPDAESAVRQGVTLALGGPDGGGPSPFAAYLTRVQALPLGINVAYLTGHNTIRRNVMGLADRAATSDELRKMQAMVAQAMGEGAFGLSTGLRYVPGYYSNLDEVVALSRTAADSGGIYTSHLREEGLGLIEGVAEAITIGERARIPVVLTHHKAIGTKMWGSSVRTLAMVDSARRRNIDVMIDQYPYTASSTGIAVLIPPWALAGGDSAFKRRIADVQLRDSIERGVVELLMTDRGGGDLRRVQFGRVSWDSTLEGKTLYDWAVKRGIEPSAAKAAALVIEAELKGGASMVYHVIDEGDVQRIMKHPMTMIASDGRLTRPGEGVPHPRAYGTFPRVLGVYVREKKVLGLEEAIKKMTSMPADRLGLKSRGRLQNGAVADVVVFDAARVADKGTFEKPHEYPVGIQHVLVNGVAVVQDGAMTTARPGKVLRRGGT